MTARKKSTKRRSRRLPRGLEDETFSIKEAAAFAGLFARRPGVRPLTGR